MPALLHASRCLVALAGALPLAAAQTTILTVPGDADTIQEAVDMAGPDTLIKVKKGFYEEAVVITGKTNLTLLGKGKPAISPGEGHDAIAIQGCDGVVVQGFKLEHGADGVDVSESTDVTIAKCLILQMSEQGVRASDCSGLLVEKNKVDGIGEHGLDIGDPVAVTDSIVRKNKVSATELHGILLGGDGNLAEKNLIKGTGGHGIETASSVPSNENIVRLNKVKDAGAFGLLANGTGNLFEKNKVTGSGEAGLGITAEATGNTFSSNTSKKSAAEGASVLGDDNTLTGCKVVAPFLDGFLVGGDGNTFEHNTSSKAGGDGFHVVGTGNDFTANKAKGSGDFDLEDDNAPGQNTYTDNVFPNSNLD